MKLIEKYKNIPLAIKASIWYIVCSVMQKAITFITTPIFTRLMSTEQYGEVTLYNSWLEVFTIFATLNLFYGVYNNILAKYPDDKDIATSSMQGLTTTITIGFFIVYLLLQNYINSLTGMTTSVTVLLFIEVLFIPAYRFWLTNQRFEYKYRHVIVATLIIAVLTPVLGVPAVILFTEKGTAKIVSNVIAQLVIAIYLYFQIFIRGKKFYHKEFWKYALIFNLPLIPHYLSSTILNQSDRIMISKLCGKSEAGIYGLAYTIGILIIFVVTAINNSFTPWIYKRFKAQKYDDIGDKSTMVTFCVAIFTIVLVTIAPEMMWILGGEKYASGVWIVAPIAISVFFRFLYNLYSNIEFYYEENYFIMLASVLCAVVNIILNYIFIKKCGFLAAGYTTLFCYILYAFSHSIFAKHVAKIHIGIIHIFNDKQIWIQAIGVTVISFAIMLLYNNIFIRYTILLIFMAVMFFFREKIIVIMNQIRRN